MVVPKPQFRCHCLGTNADVRECRDSPDKMVATQNKQGQRADAMPLQFWERKLYRGCYFFSAVFCVLVAAVVAGFECTEIVAAAGFAVLVVFFAAADFLLVAVFAGAALVPALPEAAVTCVG